MTMLSEVLSYWSASGAETLMKATIVLGGAALVSGLLRRRSAAVRHLVWTLGVVSVLALPAMRSAMPLWRVAVFPADGAMDVPVNLIDRGVDGLETTGASVGSASLSAPLAGAEPRSIEVAMVPFWQNWSLTEALFALWLVGMAAVSAWVITGYGAVRWLLRNARVVTNAQWRSQFDDARRQMGVRRQVRLLQAARALTPMTFGLFRPVIVLPANAADWAESRLRVVLLHELAHVARRDVLTQLFAQIACALYWFHPLAWLAARRLRVERERACDDAVIASGERASDYAAHLLDVARSYQPYRMLQPAALAMARSSQLEGRLLAVLKPGMDRARLKRRQITASLGAAFAVMIPVSALTPIARVASEPPATQSAEVIRHPRPSDPLSARWDWALREAGSRNRRAYWVAYSIRRESGANEAFFGGSDGFDLGELDRAPLQTQLFGTRPVRYTKEQSGLQVEQDIALLFQFRSGANQPGDAVAFRIHTMRVGMDLRNLPVYWLGPASDEESIPWLAHQFETSPVAWLKDELVEAVGVHQRADLAVPFLRGVLNNSSPGLRAQAVEALGDQGSREALTALREVVRTDESMAVRREATEALGQIRDPDAVSTLLDLALNSEDPDVRMEAAEALGDQGTRVAAQALETVLFDAADQATQQEAAESLGSIPPEYGVPILQRVAFEHSRWQVRAEAVQTLGELPAGQVLHILERVIYRDADYRVQEEAVETLEDLGRDGLALALRVMRDHPNPEVREAAADVVAAVREKRDDVDAETDVNVESDRSASPSTSASLSASPSRSQSLSPSPSGSGFGPGEALPVDIDESTLISAADARRAPDARAIMVLRANLSHEKKHENDLVRERSVWALSLVRNGEVVAPLIQALRDDDWRVRAYAAWALHATADSRALKALLAAGNDDHWRVRMHAVYALGAIEGADAERINVMIANIDDENWQVRYAAAEMLGDVATSSEAEGALRRLTADSRLMIREVAKESLRKIQSRS